MGYAQNGQEQVIESELEDHPYVYVLVRRDLSYPQIVVQTGHALIEATRAFAPTQGVHPSVIVCGIRNESRLQLAIAKLEKAGIRHSVFREPDKNNEITAVATEPISGDRRKFFSQFHLLGAEQVVSAPATQGDNV